MLLGRTLFTLSWVAIFRASADRFWARDDTDIYDLYAREAEPYEEELPFYGNEALIARAIEFLDELDLQARNWPVETSPNYLETRDSEFPLERRVELTKAGARARIEKALGKKMQEGVRYVLVGGWDQTEHQLDEYLREKTKNPEIGTRHEVVITASLSGRTFEAKRFETYVGGGKNHQAMRDYNEMPTKADLKLKGTTSKSNDDIEAFGKSWIEKNCFFGPKAHCRHYAAEVSNFALSGGGGGSRSGSPSRSSSSRRSR